MVPGVTWLWTRTTRCEVERGSADANRARTASSANSVLASSVRGTWYDGKDLRCPIASSRSLEKAQGQPRRPHELAHSHPVEPSFITATTISQHSCLRTYSPKYAQSQRRPKRSPTRRTEPSKRPRTMMTGRYRRSSRSACDAVNRYAFVFCSEKCVAEHRCRA